MSLRARSTNLDATGVLARAVARVLSPGDVVLLDGPLGAGKTAFTQRLGDALGIDDHITSPTFAIMNVYECNPQQANNTDHQVRLLAHLDAYRLGGPEGFEELGLDELLRDGAVAVIEWGSLVAAEVDNPKSITFDWVDDDTRDISLHGFDGLEIPSELKPC